MTKLFNERGVGLIEVLVALAILGVIAVAFLIGLATTAKAVLIADIRTTAESLARTQMESIKAQEYHSAEDNDVAIYDKIQGIPQGFTIYSLDRDGVVGEVVGVPWFFPLQEDPEPPNPGSAVDEDADCQMIRLIIKHGDKEIIQLDGIKVNR